MRLDFKIVDYLFWLKFAWSVWSELRESREPGKTLVDRGVKSIAAQLTEN
jgi:hypothetical protein